MSKHDLGAASLAELEAIWARILEKLRESFGKAVYTSWFRKLSLVGTEPYSNNSLRVILGAPTKFVRDWILTRYAGRIEELWQAEDQRFYSVSFTVLSCSQPDERKALASNSLGSPELSSFPEGSEGSRAPCETSFQTSENDDRTELPVASGSNDGDVMATSLDPRLTFESFVACTANGLALAAAKRLVADSPSPFNPLFLYSKVGLGKTHIMQSVAWAKLQSRPGVNIMYLSAEKFTYHFVQALRTRNMFAFKQQLRAADVFMVDDIQFISGKETTQDEFFQTFNALIDQNKQIVLSADKSPTDFEDMAERVRSRLNGGLVVDIGSYDASARLAILRRKIALGHMGDGTDLVHDETLQFLAEKITSNIRELEGGLKRLATYASITRKVVTPDTAQEILRDLIRVQDKHISIDSIQACVSAYYGVDLSAMLSGRRDRTLARARQVAMYFSKKLTSASLPEIGKKFGGRGHATVIHAVSKVEEMINAVPDLSHDFERIRLML